MLYSVLCTRHSLITSLLYICNSATPLNEYNEYKYEVVEKAAEFFTSIRLASHFVRVLTHDQEDMSSNPLRG